MQRVPLLSTRRRAAMHAERESNFAHARCVFTENFSCHTGAIVCLISFPANVGRGHVFDI